MKKALFLVATLFAGNALSATDHYILREGNHVHHLKINKLADEYKVTADVDFEPNADEKDKKACSSEIIGTAKSAGENKLTLKKHSEENASYCVLDIQLSPTGAKIGQSDTCKDFVTGICHFTSEGKELVKIK